MHPPKDYEYISHLGHGQATTWLGRSIASGEEVVIKTLELQRVDDWKGIELFEREVKTLQQISHANIPSFIRFISDEHEGAKRWHIIQEKIQGETLEIKGAHVPTEKRLKSIATQVLTTLAYLQSYSPPLLHRDVKPTNLIFSKGRIYLIDFGSVRHVVPSRMGGSTVVGTSGYMAPEQLMGRADMSSDLYGLGMTLIYLITQISPDDLEKKRMKVQWESHAKIGLSDEFRRFINKLSEPHPENRFANAEEALKGMDLSAPPPSLVPKTGSTMLSITNNQGVVHARGYGKPLRFQDSKGILGILLLCTFALILIFFNVLLLALLPILIWWVYSKTTNTYFRFDGQKVLVEKGWVLKQNFEFKIKDFLELQDKRRFKAPFVVGGTNLTGPLSFRERIKLLEELEKNAVSRYDALSEDMVLDLQNSAVNNEIEMNVEQKINDDS